VRGGRERQDRHRCYSELRNMRQIVHLKTDFLSRDVRPEQRLLGVPATGYMGFVTYITSFDNCK
jgi:hypothetical protein